MQISKQKNLFYSLRPKHNDVFVVSKHIHNDQDMFYKRKKKLPVWYALLDSDNFIGFSIFHLMEKTSPGDREQRTNALVYTEWRKKMSEWKKDVRIEKRCQKKTLPLINLTQNS